MNPITAMTEQTEEEGTEKEKKGKKRGNHYTIKLQYAIIVNDDARAYIQPFAHPDRTGGRGTPYIEWDAITLDSNRQEIESTHSLRQTDRVECTH